MIHHRLRSGILSSPASQGRWRPSFGHEGMSANPRASSEIFPLANIRSFEESLIAGQGTAHGVGQAYRHDAHLEETLGPSATTPSVDLGTSPLCHI